MTPRLRSASRISVFFAVALSAAACQTAAKKRTNDEGRAAWRKVMLGLRTPKPGCWEAAYPSQTWKQVKCGPPVKGHLDIGNIYADQQIASNGPIAKMTGQFLSVNASILGVTDSYTPCTSAVTRPNVWGIQLNTNIYPDPFPGVAPGDSQYCSAPGACTGWVQFGSSGGGPLAYMSGGSAYISYWLFPSNPNATIACPTHTVVDPDYDNGQPSFWVQNGSFCGAVSGNATFPDYGVDQLGKYELSGMSDGGMDQVTVTLDGLAHSHSLPSPMKLNPGWTSGEFNIFGTGNGNCAVFGPNSTLVLADSIAGPKGASRTASCGSMTSTTLEENSLSFPPLCPCFAQGDAITFTESNAANPVCACPNGLAWDQFTMSCKPCPFPGQYVKNGVCICAPGKSVQENKVCGCPPGTIYDVKIFGCVAPPCPPTCVNGCWPPYEGPSSDQPIVNCKPTGTPGVPGTPVGIPKHPLAIPTGK